jgi:hypothetical protein
MSRVAKPWELAMADEFEDHFALIRGLLHSIAQVRKVLRKHQALERSTPQAKYDLYESADARQQSRDMTDVPWERRRAAASVLVTRQWADFCGTQGESSTRPRKAGRH